MDTLYAITWKYGDNSGSGVVRVYDTQEAADRDAEMLAENSDGTRQFQVVPVPYIDG